MMRYLVLLLSLFLFIGCEDGYNFTIFDDDSVIQETIIDEVDEEEIVQEDEKEEEGFPGSTVVTGEKAQKVIDSMEKEYWLSDSGVLHNSLCRWYKKSKGQVWDNVTAFENCKNCGGTVPIVREWNLSSEAE